MYSTEQIIVSSYYSGFGLFYMKSFLHIFAIWHKQKIQEINSNDQLRTLIILIICRLPLAVY